MIGYIDSISADADVDVERAFRPGAGAAVSSNQVIITITVKVFDTANFGTAIAQLEAAVKDVLEVSDAHTSQ